MKKLLLLLFCFSLFASLDSPILYSKSEKNMKNEEEGDNPQARFDEFNYKRSYPNASIPENALSNAYKQKQDLLYSNRKNKNLAQSLQPEWKAVGPFDIGGRIKSIVIHPKDPNIAYAGAAAGGIWKTTDGGDNWSPLFQDENSIAFGSLAIDPKYPDTLYAATGEAVSGGNIYGGTGVYKSTDAGKTWKLKGLTGVTAFSRIFVHPTNSNIIIAGGILRGKGLYISKDAGESWEKVFQDGSVSDVGINTQDPNEIVIGVSGVGVIYTNNQGKNWTNLTVKPLPTDTIGRVSVQISPSEPNVYYTLFAHGANSGTVYKSDNKGKSWTRLLDASKQIFISGGNSQGFYDNYIEINPTNSNICYAGGIDTWITKDGTTFYNSTQSYQGGGVHPDQHCAAFAPSNPNIVYIGNDGGIFKSTIGGDSWVAKNNNLTVSQFYDLGVDNYAENINFGGTQDNGTLGNPTNDWGRLAGGDGFQVAVDGKNKTFWGESQYGNIFRIKYGSGSPVGANWSNGLPSPTSANALFNSPLLQDPNPDQGYIWAARKNLYFADKNGDGDWTEYPKEFLNVNEFITTIAIAYKKPELMYVSTISGKVLVTKNIEMFNEVQNNGLVNRIANQIVTSPFEIETAYICFSGFGVPHLFKTTNAGDSWTNVSGNLPDVPINDLLINPDDKNNLFIATDVGVFATYNDGQTWFPYGRNLPNTPCLALDILNNKDFKNTKMLRVGTHGRSAWEIEIPTEPVIEPEITAPIGGEEYVANTNMNISWYGFTPPVKVETSTNNGETWTEIVPSTVGNAMLWMVWNRPTFQAKIRVSSIQDPSQTKTSNTFSILMKSKGSILTSNPMSFIPYGIAIDRKGFMWASDFGGNKLHKLDVNTFQEVSSFKLKNDSLYTDLTIDRATGKFYLHKINTADASGGKVGGYIQIYDESGKFIQEYKSASDGYPIGIEFVDGNLVLTDRDSDKKIRFTNPATGQVLKTFSNPCTYSSGPRGLCYDGVSTLFHVCTNFSSGGLTDASVLKLNKDNVTVSESSFSLETFNGVINARGVEFDPSDRNLWVSTYDGSTGTIYKIAGFETVSDVEKNWNESRTSEIETYIAPNPISDLAHISFKLLENNANVKVSLVDLMGNELGIVFDNFVSKDEAKVITYKNDNLASGTYYLLFNIDNKSVHKQKMLVIK